MLGAPELDAALQVGSHQGGAEGENPLPWPAAHMQPRKADESFELLGHIVESC